MGRTVRPGWRARLRDVRVRRAGDGLIAVGLTGTSVVAVLAGSADFGAPRWLALLLAVCSTLPVWVRRRWPMPVAAVLLFANGAVLAAAAPHEASLQPFIALVLAAYSVGSLTEGRFALTGPAVLAVLALPVFVLAYVDGQSLGNEIASYVWLVAAWAVGRVVRQMRIKTRDLEALNAALAEHRERAAEVAVTLERGRIARELHDVIAHNVSMMVIQAAAAERVLKAEEPKVRAALQTISTTGRQTVEEMRSLLGVLRSGDAEEANRAPQPGLADLDALTALMCRSGIAVTWSSEGTPYPMPRPLDLSAYRIVQEALTNSMKHAPGARAEVVVRYAEGTLWLDITDSGGARDRSTDGEGHGLVGMRERAALFGGEVSTMRTADGYRVTARLPVPEGGTG